MYPKLYAPSGQLLGFLFLMVYNKKIMFIRLQSLLTDPYTDVCMEPEIGRIYVEKRKRFDAIARTW